MKSRSFLDQGAYHWIINNRSTTGATSAAEIVYYSEASKFLVFSWIYFDQLNVYMFLVLCCDSRLKKMMLFPDICIVL